MGAAQAEETFAAALLQDMAVPILAKEVREAYARLFDARHTSRNRIRLSRLEEHVFGWNHATAAGIMARQWQLPESLAALVEDHLSVEQHLSDPNADPAKLVVAMSAPLPAVDDEDWTEFAKLDDSYGQVRPLDGPSIEVLLGKVDQEFADIAPLLRVSSPQVSADRQLPSGRRCSQGLKHSPARIPRRKRLGWGKPRHVHESCEAI